MTLPGHPAGLNTEQRVLPANWLGCSAALYSLTLEGPSEYTPLAILLLVFPTLNSAQNPCLFGEGTLTLNQ